MVEAWMVQSVDAAIVSETGKPQAERTGSERIKSRKVPGS